MALDVFFCWMIDNDDDRVWYICVFVSNDHHQQEKLFLATKTFSCLERYFQSFTGPLPDTTQTNRACNKCFFSLVGCEKNRKSSIKLDHSLDHLVAVWSIFFLLQSSTAVFVWYECKQQYLISDVRLLIFYIFCFRRKWSTSFWSMFLVIIMIIMMIMIFIINR